MNNIKQKNINYRKCIKDNKFMKWLKYFVFPASERYNAQYDQSTVISVFLKSMMTKSSVVAHTRSKKHLPSSEWFRKILEIMAELHDIEKYLII